MNKKPLLLSTIILGVGMLALVPSLKVYADSKDTSVMGPHRNMGSQLDKESMPCDSERHDTMEKALEDGDYDTWKSLMPGHAVDVVTKENFDKFRKMHESMEKGDTDEADEIRKDLGLGMGMGMMHGSSGRGMMGDSH